MTSITPGLGGENMSVEITEATAQTWASQISDLSRPIIAMFYMVSCPACNKIKPVFESLASAFSDRVSFIRIEAMDNLSVTNSYGIRTAPTFLLFKDGSLFQTLDAPSEEALRKAVEDLSA